MKALEKKRPVCRGDIDGHGLSQYLPARYNGSLPEDCAYLGFWPLDGLFGVSRHLLKGEAVNITLQMLGRKPAEAGGGVLEAGHQRVHPVHRLYDLAAATGRFHLDVPEAVATSESLIAVSAVGDEGLAPNQMASGFFCYTTVWALSFCLAVLALF